MPTPETELELTVVYVEEENGWITATIPAVPGTISAGSSKDKARTNVLDALRMMLSVPPKAGSRMEKQRGCRFVSTL
jgi:predicted RNase H-like HicB family nuclease